MTLELILHFVLKFISFNISLAKKTQLRGARVTGMQNIKRNVLCF